MDRHAVRPARLVARTVIVFAPVSSGTAEIVQVAAPDAVPVAPAELVQVTEAMPPLSRAVPLIAMDAAEVDSVVNTGDVMVRLGGDVLAAGGAV